MTTNKKPVKSQKYEDYWRLTLAYSDINGAKFRDTLEMIYDQFISENWEQHGATSKEFQDLTKQHHRIYGFADEGSSRKALNQFIKLGFFKPGFKEANPNTSKFIKAKSDADREHFFSDIFYNWASFNSSYSNDKTDQKQVNFLIKTLLYHPKKMLNINELKALSMVGDLTKYKAGYMKQEELATQIRIMEATSYQKRKYNQSNYLITCLSKLKGLSFNRDQGLAYTENGIIKVLAPEEIKRDPYQWRLTRENLQNESIKNYNKVQCYYSYYTGKGLVASHIIPFSELMKQGNVSLAYDYKNTLLLRPDVDAYFDKNDISFDSEGQPLFSKKLSQTIVDELLNYSHHSLDTLILDDKRQKLMESHREKFYNKQL